MTTMTIAFNENSERPRFIYRPNTANPKAFQIFQFEGDKRDYEPVGDYIVLDGEEGRDLTEKKLMNLISLMNGQSNVIDLSNEVSTKTLYHVKPRTRWADDTQIVFRTYDGTGVSTENALLKVKGGIFDA